jgi:hypothetical protein
MSSAMAISFTSSLWAVTFHDVPEECRGIHQKTNADSDDDFEPREKLAGCRQLIAAVEQKFSSGGLLNRNELAHNGHVIGIAGNSPNEISLSITPDSFTVRDKNSPYIFPGFFDEVGSKFFFAKTNEFISGRKILYSDRNFVMWKPLPELNCGFERGHEITYLYELRDDSHFL